MGYTTVFFDLDNTLLDFHKAEHSAAEKLFAAFGLPNGDDIIKMYSDINLSFWKRFESGEIEKSEIFVNRFTVFTEKLNKPCDCEKMAEMYIDFLSKEHEKIEGADDILRYLKQKGYLLYATTNGHCVTQNRRIKEAGFDNFFADVFLSETIGHQKPEREYFEYILENIPETDKDRILIIGDSQSSDVLGGINIGIDTCWFNLLNEEKKYPSKYEIRSLEEIKDIL